MINPDQISIPNNTITLSKYSKLVLDSQYEAFFNEITDLTSKMCLAPVALITFVSEEAVFVQSPLKPNKAEMMPNKGRFCGVFPPEKNYFEISDTDADIAHASHEFYIEGIKAKFYAGAKIKLPLGEVIGVLCIFDIEPRTLSSIQREYLLGMARVIEKSLLTKNFLRNLV